MLLQAPMLQPQLNGFRLPAQSMGAHALAQAQASALQQQLVNQQLATQHMGGLQQQVRLFLPCHLPGHHMPCVQLQELDACYFHYAPPDGASVSTVWNSTLRALRHARQSPGACVCTVIELPVIVMTHAALSW